MNRKSNVWWFPLARRVLGWGAAGALLWALPVAALIGSLALYVHLHPSPPSPNVFIPDDDFFVGILLWLCAISSGIFALIGAIAGGVAAFYAPATDVKNPLKSQFFRTVGRQTFWFTVAASLACGLTLGIVSYFLFGSILLFVVWFALSAALFFLGLWRAVNRALHAATASNYNA